MQNAQRTHHDLHPLKEWSRKSRAGLIGFKEGSVRTTFLRPRSHLDRKTPLCRHPSVTQGERSCTTRFLTVPLSGSRQRNVGELELDLGLLPGLDRHRLRLHDRLALANDLGREDIV